MDADASDLKKQIQRVLAKELDRSSEVLFTETEIVVYAFGLKIVFAKPEEKKSPYSQPFRIMSRENPFKPAEGDELEMLRAEMAAFLNSPREQRRRSFMPAMTKRTCEILAQARAMGNPFMERVLLDEAVLCIGWEWPGATLFAGDDGVHIEFDGRFLFWDWSTLHSEADQHG